MVGKIKQRLTMAQKSANNHEWYREMANSLDLRGFTTVQIPFAKETLSEQRRMQANYDLFNGFLDLSDFEYVCRPYGMEVGELPARMRNHDIISNKVKYMIGLEMRIPLKYKVIAVNKDATTRKEQEKFGRIRDFVIQEVQQQVQQQVQQLNPEQGDMGGQSQQQQVQTPEEVMRYMERDHQDPAEVLANQLLDYLKYKEHLRDKFNTAFKHLCLSGREILYLGIMNDEPVVWNVNSLRFRCDMSPDNVFIEDGEWATCEFRMSPSDVVMFFGEDLTNEEMEKVYEMVSPDVGVEEPTELLFDHGVDRNGARTVRVLHCVWKALRKLRFLTYLDENDEVQETTVDESYTFSSDAGDLNIEDHWIPEVYETWKIGADIYVRMRPVPGQFKDLDNLYHCKLPYYGVISDGMNSKSISIMDRMKPYQYYYNIVMYRLEMLMSSDKGRKIMMNVQAIPDSAGIDIQKWQYFFDASGIMWYDPSAEGITDGNVNSIAKEVNLSLASDISKYMELLEYIKRQAGNAIGITDRMEGEVGNREAAANYHQALQQASNILEPYYNLHNQMKRNVLEGLIEMAKVAYATSKPKKLVYILDDLSQKVLDLDVDMLQNSTYGLFLSDNPSIEDTKMAIQQLAQAALQNQQVELADVIAVLRQESPTEAEEVLRVAQKKRQEREEQMQQQQAQEAEKLQKAQQDFEMEKLKFNAQVVKMKEEERRKTEIVKMSLTGASFNPDKDSDVDGVNDFLEIASTQGLKVEEVRAKNQLAQQKLEQERDLEQQRIDLEREKIELEREKIKQEASRKKE